MTKRKGEKLEHAPFPPNGSFRIDEQAEQALEYAVTIWPSFINERTKAVNLSGLVKRALEDWFWMRHRSGGKTTMILWEEYRTQELIKAQMRGDERDPDEILAELDFEEFVAKHSVWRDVDADDDSDSVDD